MSPRRNYRRRGSGRPVDREVDQEHVRRGIERMEVDPDGEWSIRLIPGGAAGKSYRCPGCDQEIQPGVAHLVAWPADGRGDLSDRRHWHSGCWRARDRRRPIVQRSRNAPHYG